MDENADRMWKQKRAQQIVETITDVLWETDARLIVTHMGPLDRELRGYGPEEVVGKYALAFLAGDSQQSVTTAVAGYAQTLRSANPAPLVLKDVEQVCKDGNSIWTDIVMCPVVENSVLTGFVCATRDATARKRAENQMGMYNEQIDHLNRELERLPATDRLTGLSGRDKVAEVWNHEVSRVKRYRTALSLVLVNLDSFRQINVARGHAQGDAVLVEVSRILKRFIRDNDNAFRWGNDEFIFLLPHTTKDQGRIQAERLRQTIEQHRFPVPDRITISAGVTEYVDGDTVETIVVRADSALNTAKLAGRNQVEVR